MRFVSLALIALFVLSISGAARADGPFDLQQAQEVRRARDLRSAGIALTMTGIACEIATIALWTGWILQLNALNGRYGDEGGGPSVPLTLTAAAIATSAAAPALLIGGITMWSVGAHRQERLADSVTVSADGALHF
jgi:hypothetical protein